MCIEFGPVHKLNQVTELIAFRESCPFIEIDRLRFCFGTQLSDDSFAIVLVQIR